MDPHGEVPSRDMGTLDRTSVSHLSKGSSPLSSATYPSDASFSSTSVDMTFDETSINPVDGSMQSLPRPSLRPGVYVPTVAFFDPETEDLDTAAIAAHALRLARAGVAGITTQGSNGEAVHLSPIERDIVTSTTRSALHSAGYNHIPVIVGCGAQSTRDVIGLTRSAAAAGGTHVLVLPPSYYRASYAKSALKRHFQDVANRSPLPVLIYNYPGAVAGIDFSSDDILSLASHPNIVGCKLTCGNTGKLCRIASALSNPKLSPRSKDSKPFLTFGGSADFLLPTLMQGGAGVIAGLGNLVPRSLVKLFDVCGSGQMEEAQKLQAIVARADWGVIEGGVVGTKAAMRQHFGYGGFARRPLRAERKSEETDEEERWGRTLEECIEVEKTLGDV